jgi:4-methylaminobutanoate oxidase (formaldehyde-forming)
MVYTGLLNAPWRLRERPDRDAPGRRPLLARHRLGAAAARRRLDRRHIGADAAVTITDVSALWTCVLSVMGPRSRELLARVSPDDLSPAGLKFATRRRSTSAWPACAPRA